MGVARTKRRRTDTSVPAAPKLCVWPAWTSRLRLMWLSQKLVAKVLAEQNIHGSLIAAVLRDMDGLEGEANFENVESTFPFTKCSRQGSVEASRPWLKIAKQMLWNVE